jgi:chaperone required for assembly of F1-ATPase
MKRFYKETGVDEGEGGFRVLLDGKPMRTPAKATLVVPTRALAEAIAAEWASVPDKAEINAALLPLTRLAATGIDRVVSRRDEVIADTAKYAGSDLLCYRATAPDSLVKLQQDRWQPLLDWAVARHGARLVTADGIGFVEQPSEARDRLREAVAAHGDLALSAVYNLTHIAGSVVIALAVSDGRLDAEEAFTAAQTDELYQIDRWGDDPTAEKQREGVRRDIGAGACFLSLLENARLRG